MVEPKTIKSLQSFSVSRVYNIKKYLRTFSTGPNRHRAVAHFNQIYIDDVYCDVHLMSGEIFRKYVDLVKHIVVKDFPDVRELCLDYCLSGGSILESHMRTLVLYPKRGLTGDISKLMQLINNGISVNYPSRAVVLQDELSFAAAGYPGVFMALDFRQLQYQHKLYFLLIGCSYDGSLRHLEIIEAKTELNALQKSKWLEYMCGNEVNFPPSFLVYTNKEEQVMVPSIVLVDAQMSIGLYNLKIHERIRRHVVGPLPWAEVNVNHCFQET